MARFAVLFTTLTAISGAAASLVAQARRALAERQSSGSQPNAVQNWVSLAGGRLRRVHALR